MPVQYLQQPQQPPPQPLSQTQPQLRLMTRKELTDPFGSDDEEDQPLPTRNGVHDTELGEDIQSYPSLLQSKGPLNVLKLA